MTILFSDPFNRAAGAVGNGWTVSTVNAYPVLTGTELSLGPTVGPSLIYRSDFPTVDAIQVADLKMGAASSVGFLFRVQSVNTFLNVDILPVSPGAPYGRVTLISSASGVETTLYTGDLPAANPIAIDIYATLTVSLIGDTYVVKQNGTQIFSYTDIATAGHTAITTSGGIGLRNGTGGTGNRLAKNYSLDNNVAAAATVAPTFTVAPAIIGTPQVGVVTSYTSGTFSGTPTPVSSQQWTLDGVDISGATGATYTPIAGDAAHLLRVRQIATNSVGAANSVSASTTVAASTPVAPTVTTAPVIVGNPQVGIATTYTSGTFTGSPTPTLSQQWTLDAIDIVGATSASYTPIAGDATHLLRVRQIATNSAGTINATSASATVLTLTQTPPLTKTASGLTYSADFSSLASWSSTDSSFTSDATRASYDSFSLAVPVLSPASPGTLDGSGCREPNLQIDINGRWHLFYDAGDGGTVAATANWRTKRAYSDNQGLTWTKAGDVVYNGIPAQFSTATSHTHVIRFNGLYYAFTMCPNGYGNSIPSPDYHTMVFSAPALEGPYTVVGETLALGAAGSFDQSTAQIACVVNDVGTLTAYYCARTASVSGTAWTVGRATAPNPGGTWIKDGNGGATVSNLINNATNVRAENPHVWYSRTLGKWAMLCNSVDSTSAYTDGNDIIYGDTSVGFAEPAAGTITPPYRNRVQRLVPSDSLLAVGMGTPLRDQNGLTIEDNSGRVAMVWDGDPPGNFNGTGANVGYHLGRRIRAAILEPVSACLKVTGAPVAGGYLLRTVTPTDFILQATVEFQATSGQAQVAYRMTSGVEASNNGYVLDFNTSTNVLTLSRKVGATYTSLATVNRVGFPVAPDARNSYLEHIKVVVTGNRHQVYLDSTTAVIDYTDAAPTTPGNLAGFRNPASTSNLRIKTFNIRTSEAVLFSGLPSSAVVVMRTAGFPLVTGTADASGNLSVVSPHYPVGTIQVNGINIKPISGDIWGGDVFSYAYTAAATPTLTARTVSFTLGDSTGALANLTGLKVAFYDEATPDLLTTARYKTATGTTSATGVLTFSVNSTLAGGGTGHVTVLTATGQHFNGSVVVA